MRMLMFRVVRIHLIAVVVRRSLMSSIVGVALICVMVIVVPTVTVTPMPSATMSAVSTISHKSTSCIICN